MVEKPETQEWLDYYWRAFLDLSTTRQIGMGAGPIPWTAINEWAARHGVTDIDDFEDLAFIVQRLDGEHLRLIAPKDG